MVVQELRQMLAQHLVALTAMAEHHGAREQLLLNGPRQLAP
jgi:hypothetical protein